MADSSSTNVSPPIDNDSLRATIAVLTGKVDEWEKAASEFFESTAIMIRMPDTDFIARPKDFHAQLEEVRCRHIPYYKDRMKFWSDEVQGQCQNMLRALGDHEASKIAAQEASANTQARLIDQLRESEKGEISPSMRLTRLDQQVGLLFTRQDKAGAASSASQARIDDLVQQLATSSREATMLRQQVLIREEETHTSQGHIDDLSRDLATSSGEAATRNRQTSQGIEDTPTSQGHIADLLTKRTTSSEKAVMLKQIALQGIEDTPTSQGHINDLVQQDIVKTLRKEIREIQIEMERTKDLLEISEKEKTKAIEPNSPFMKAARTLRHELSNSMLRSAQARQQLEISNEQLKKIEAERSQLQQENSVLVNQVQQLETKDRQLQSDNDGLESYIDEIAEELNHVIQDLDEEQSFSFKMSQGFGSEMTDLRAEQDKAEKLNEHLAGELKSANAKMCQAKAAKTDLESSQGGLMSQLANLRAELAAMKERQHAKDDSRAATIQDRLRPAVEALVAGVQEQNQHILSQLTEQTDVHDQVRAVLELVARELNKTGNRLGRKRDLLIEIAMHENALDDIQYLLYRHANGHSANTAQTIADIENRLNLHALGEPKRKRRRLNGQTRDPREESIGSDSELELRNTPRFRTNRHAFVNPTVERNTSVASGRQSSPELGSPGLEGFNHGSSVDLAQRITPLASTIRGSPELGSSGDTTPVAQPPKLVPAGSSTLRDSTVNGILAMISTPDNWDGEYHELLRSLFQKCFNGKASEEILAVLDEHVTGNPIRGVKPGWHCCLKAALTKSKVEVSGSAEFREQCKLHMKSRDPLCFYLTFVDGVNTHSELPGPGHLRWNFHIRPLRPPRRRPGPSE